MFVAVGPAKRLELKWINKNGWMTTKMFMLKIVIAVT